jgi:hypothetical protein
MWRVVIVLLLSRLSAGLDKKELAAPYPGPPTDEIQVKKLPLAKLYTLPPDDGLQVDPKHVEVW